MPLLCCGIWRLKKAGTESLERHADGRDAFKCWLPGSVKTQESQGWWRCCWFGTRAKASNQILLKDDIPQLGCLQNKAVENISWGVIKLTCSAVWGHQLTA